MPNILTSNPSRTRKVAEGLFRRRSFATAPPEGKLFLGKVDLFKESLEKLRVAATQL
jgi:hypothetical protein